MQNEKSFDTGELTLNYVEEGSTKPPMVLLHGLTANKGGWMPLLPELTSNWHVYAPDFRGHGKSGRAPDDQYHNVDYARDIIAFLKFIGEPAVLVGHSLGAMVAIVTAAQYPAGVRAIVLLDPPLFSYFGSVRVLRPDVAQGFSMVAEVVRGNPSHDEIVARLRAAMPDAPDEQITGMAEFFAGVAPGAPETAFRDESWQGVDLPHALHQIKCPTLMIHGDWNSGAAIREEDVAFFKSNCPSATIVHLSGADHGLKMMEQPELVLEPMRTFLQSV
jgi:pimeloyl-ACP methyl ester carboxylesterase